MPSPKAKGCIEQDQVDRSERRYEAVRAYLLRGVTPPNITRNLISLQRQSLAEGRPDQHDYFEDVDNFDSNYRLVRKARERWEKTLQGVVDLASPLAKGTLVERLEMVIEQGMRVWQDPNAHVLMRTKGFDKAIEAMIRVARVLGVDTEMKLDLSLYVGAEDPAVAAARAIRDFVDAQKSASEARNKPATKVSADDADENGPAN